MTELQGRRSIADPDLAITNAFIPSTEEVCGLQIDQSMDFDPPNCKDFRPLSGRIDMRA